MSVSFFQAIQIMIGLMHTDFEIILGLMASIYNQVLGFASLSFTGGYPFWGDLSVSSLLQQLSFAVYQV